MSGAAGGNSNGRVDVDSDMQDATSDVSQLSEDEFDAILDAAFDQLVTDFGRQVRAEGLDGPAGGSARGHGPRTPRYLHPQDGLGAASQWRKDYTRSTLWEHLQTKQVLSDGAKEFFQLLRIPRELFDCIYTRAVNSGSFPLHPVHDDHPPGHARQGRGAPAVPLKVKIAAAFRYMATGGPMESVASFVHGDKATLQAFFHDFVQWMVVEYYEEKVTGSTGIGFDNDDAISRSERLFRGVGLPGIISSMDGVHLAWSKAPSRQKWMYKGKEGYPTLALNVHCTHNLRIIYIAPICTGASNDKTMVRQDALVIALRKDPRFRDKGDLLWCLMHDARGSS